MALALRRGSQGLGHRPARRVRRRQPPRRLPPRAPLLRERQGVVAPRRRREPRGRRAARVRVRRGVRGAQEPRGDEPADGRPIGATRRGFAPSRAPSMRRGGAVRARGAGQAPVHAILGRDDRHRGRSTRRGGPGARPDGAQGDGPVGVGRRGGGRELRRRGASRGVRTRRDENSGGGDRNAPSSNGGRWCHQIHGHHARHQIRGGGACVRAVRARGAEPRGCARETRLDARRAGVWG
mmetsp:Transcript_7896/g.31296  ORF Transcript_7896/g.31296 Transcript_7896/m.31296 type:complete len:238 (+) Transcript_7896:358-1071(+)